MKFYIITIFPEIVEEYFKHGVLAGAVESGKIEVEAVDLREYAFDKHKKVDDTPYGGGPGMVLKADVIWNCLSALSQEIEKFGGVKATEKTKTVLLSAKGDQYNQRKACQWSRELENLILICGRYEGVDERVADFMVDEEISAGEYVLTGGELPAMAVADSVARLIPGVLGNEESLFCESFNQEEKERGSKVSDYPVYTKPENFRGWKVPEVLLSGNHQEIAKWREQNKIKKD
ncbi:MAG: tRNA (guanosine(37)-N1)-methyltransferase TrmD [Patescibacteria group bacterium]